jgi:hypothetical protein
MLWTFLKFYSLNLDPRRQLRVLQFQEVYLRMKIRQKAEEMNLGDEDLAGLGMPQ